MHALYCYCIEIIENEKYRPISELWHKELAKVFNLESILANGDKAPSLLNGGLSSVWATGMLMMSIIIASLLEGKAMNSGEVFWGADKPAGSIFLLIEMYCINYSKQ